MPTHFFVHLILLYLVYVFYIDYNDSEKNWELFIDTGKTGVTWWRILTRMLSKPVTINRITRIFNENKLK